ncbi:MAG TPA: hypothetical protein VLI21_13105 [Casimicrobiaceae bacterium]|nr:hypothetical protein [Casimicrobiaceae bacterium]
MMGDARSDDVADQLLHVLSRVHAHHEERLRDAELGKALAYLAMWQVRRLRNTYADLQAIPRYAAAMQFFESDLYGGGDFAQRDADLARVVPGMKRLLPDHALRTVVEAVEVNALAQDFDRAMIDHLPRREGAFGVAEYCAAYRAVDRFDERRRQILLLSHVGEALDALVRKPMIRSALKLMRKPARLAGLAALQDFLERGFGAFANMGGAREFLATIEARELAIVESIAAGSDRAFPDPMTRPAESVRESRAR